ncbi:TBC1 domain family member 2B [Trichonephila inaurata madagascariensis]|uniref:TBC1 domain family member 2B n=1 Tax=Trichonephila inaurata madagascariensis TaxID=2747483 RepID=A0A8X6YXE6_9ARAC|nr:TBC1 domain family member 2B [Trichonephila inaurata madagascariensis]
MSRGRSRSDSNANLQASLRGPLTAITPTFSKNFGGIVLRKALSRLKGRKRLWFVLDESKCRLLYYKSEIEARSKDPLGAIEIRGAAISLALEEDNQFVVHSNGREHALVAEDHESMMLWILALQARQDKPIPEPSTEASTSSKRKQQPPSSHTSNNAQPNLHTVAASVKSKVLQRTHSLQLHPERRHDALRRMHSLWTTTSQDTDPIPNGKGDTDLPSCSIPPVKQPSVVEESPKDESPPSPTIGAMAWSTDTNNNDRDQGRGTLIREPSTDRSSDTESCDDSDPSDPPEGGSDRVRLLRKMNSEGMTPQDLTPLKDRANSLSGTSVSSDSAVGTSDCSASIRLQELESELMCTKCDLAKALNREAAYKSIIEEKILLVNELEERLRAAEDPDGDAVWKSPVHKAGSGSLQEKCRILQNHNRFLNEEVLKLAKMMQQEKKNTEMKHQQMRQLESEVDQLKRDYVFLMQSSLRINNCDGPEIMEVYLYGGNRHKERVLSLLEEARRINPTLPVYENMARGLYHVDGLGFRRSFAEESLIVHYICRQLHQHYSALGPQYEHHQQQWKKYLRQNPTLPTSKELKILVRKGIPIHLRSRVWAILYRSRVSDIMESKGPHYYNFLCSLAPDDERVSHHKRQIALDLLRTMPDNIRFTDSNADGVRKMQEVLQAFCVHNPALGYCQGMNFLVGMCLLFLEPEDAFWCLVAVTERYFTANYFDQNLIGAQADQEVLKDLLREKMPLLWQHFAQVDIELCTVTLNWFLAIFFDCVPFEVYEI